MSHFLNHSEIEAYIKTYLNEHSVTCFDFNVRGGLLIVSGNTDQEASQAMLLLRDAVVERVITLDQEAVLAVYSKQWKQRVEEWTFSFPWQAKFCIGKNAVSVCAIKDVIVKAVVFVFNFLERCTKYKDNGPLTHPTYQLLSDYHRDELQRIEEVNHIYQVTVKLDVSLQRLAVSGTRQGIRNANLDIQQLLGRVRSEFYLVSIPGVYAFALSEEGQEQIFKVELENLVVVQILKSESMEG